MDKDLIILKNQELKTEAAEKELETIEQSQNEQQTQLDELQQRLNRLYEKTGKTKIVEVPKVEENAPDACIHEVFSGTYDDLFEESKQALIAKGLDVDSIGFDAFLSETELSDIISDLDSALPRSDWWKKSDYIVVFIAALVGGIADAILGDRKNGLTGKGSKFSDRLNEIHEKKWKHKSGAPIDFQGKVGDISFGGGNHRELSKGHDLLRFVDGIKSFKNGTFEAVGYRNGEKILITSLVNQNGTPYQAMTTGAAIIEYCHHMFADLFSNNSLPFPGYSFLRESDKRDLRKFSADMYAQGFNLKNVIIQAASTIAIEIIIRLSFSIQSVKKYKDSVEIAEDYSNWEAVKQFMLPANKDKLNEMLLVAHTIVTALNVGKIVITKNIASINVTEILSVVNYGIKVLNAAAKRNNEYAKLIYHSSEVQDRWNKMGEAFGLNDEALVLEMNEKLVLN